MYYHRIQESPVAFVLVIINLLVFCALIVMFRVLFRSLVVYTGEICIHLCFEMRGIVIPLVGMRAVIDGFQRKHGSLLLAVCRY